MGFVDFNGGGTFFLCSSLLVDLWVLFDELGFDSVSPCSLFTFSKFALALVSGEISAPTKTENFAANSIRVSLEGKRCEGTGVLRRYYHEALDFVAELEGFEFSRIFLQFLVGVGKFL
ncbi:hypothetical protein FCV25MIE_12953 [Fagus crenata]